ncbi:flavin reductase family protein [Antarcticirhabdus aurantiaca]|uniref:Flavin reductase family protein n=1 Tax=Antarcticirhabdus aurantiaca TaxID=2606717 RepID=A0ACD4NHX7_9HYPH|nr:flavin reductase family protein [Antarcticirhabdus aurantiaca]WAJ26394.1 flavin reductase family protein [Jeongeuplla avenae]
MSALAVNIPAPPSPAVDPRTYRSVLGRFVTGVTVMTVGGAGLGRAGVTANSFNTVSLDPPLILWSLALKAPSLSLFRAHEHFGVSILAAHQRETALAFARPSPDKFAGVAIKHGETGVPLVSGAMAHLECRVAHRYPGGDHEIIVGEVLRLTGGDHQPLVFHGGRFCNVLEDDPAA